MLLKNIVKTDGAAHIVKEINILIQAVAKHNTTFNRSRIVQEIEMNAQFFYEQEVGSLILPKQTIILSVAYLIAHQTVLSKGSGWRQKEDLARSWPHLGYCDELNRQTDGWLC